MVTARVESGARILVVAHSGRARQAVRSALERDGYVVDESGDGREALATLEDSAARVDLVITDVYLPELDGLSLVRRARKLPRYRSMPILVLTSECGEDMQHRGRVAGATAWLVQPVPAAELVRVVGRALEGA